MKRTVLLSALNLVCSFTLFTSKTLTKNTIIDKNQK